MERLIHHDIPHKIDLVKRTRLAGTGPQLHILQQKAKVTSNTKIQICHYALMVVDGAHTLTIMQHHPRSWLFPDSIFEDEAVVTPLPRAYQKLESILECDGTLSKKPYMLWKRDCRHHVSDLLSFCYLL
jgi:hypothetical protein